jgi:hypothetical protein
MTIAAIRADRLWSIETTQDRSCREGGSPLCKGTMLGSSASDWRSVLYPRSRQPTKLFGALLRASPEPVVSAT